MEKKKNSAEKNTESSARIYIDRGTMMKIMMMLIFFNIPRTMSLMFLEADGVSVLRHGIVSDRERIMDPVFLSA